jgi:hypothetical protein
VVRLLPEEAHEAAPAAVDAEARRERERPRAEVGVNDDVAGAGAARAEVLDQGSGQTLRAEPRCDDDALQVGDARRGGAPGDPADHPLLRVEEYELARARARAEARLEQEPVKTPHLGRPDRLTHSEARAPGIDDVGKDERPARSGRGAQLGLPQRFRAGEDELAERAAVLSGLECRLQLRQLDEAGRRLARGGAACSKYVRR